MSARGTCLPRSFHPFTLSLSLFLPLRNAIVTGNKQTETNLADIRPPPPPLPAVEDGCSEGCDEEKARGLKERCERAIEGRKERKERRKERKERGKRKNQREASSDPRAPQARPSPSPPFLLLRALPLLLHTLPRATPLDHSRYFSYFCLSLPFSFLRSCFSHARSLYSAPRDPRLRAYRRVISPLLPQRGDHGARTGEAAVDPLSELISPGGSESYVSFLYLGIA